MSDEKTGIYCVVRVSNGMIVDKINVFDEKDVENVKKCAIELYKTFSASGVVPRDLPVYLETCLREGLKFVYPFDGNVYENENIVIERVNYAKI